VLQVAEGSPAGGPGVNDWCGLDHALVHPTASCPGGRGVPGAAGHEERFVEKKLFVGNLPYNMTDADLEQTFSAHST